MRGAWPLKNKLEHQNQEFDVSLQNTAVNVQAFSNI